MATSCDIESDSEPYNDSATHSDALHNTDLYDGCYNMAHGNRFQELDYLMSPDLKKQIFEILILSHDNDTEEARRLQNLLSTNVVYRKGSKLVCPTVELLSDVILEDPSATEELDFALNKTLFVFLLATSSFCADDWAKLLGHASLRNSLDKKKHFLIVIHTQNSSSREYNLPIILSAVRSLEYSVRAYALDKFTKNVRTMLESQVATLLEKEKRLCEQRYEFLRGKHPNELSDFLKNNNLRKLAQPLPLDHQNIMTSSETVPILDQGNNGSCDIENETEIANVSTDSDSDTLENGIRDMNIS
ncbi:hypothetical protein Btru_066981 [Bulinus truncatus]|nr:hypothetical protein Btru_066981 [Bulinus truncatus]